MTTITDDFAGPLSGDWSVPGALPFDTPIADGVLHEPAPGTAGIWGVQHATELVGDVVASVVLNIGTTSGSEYVSQIAASDLAVTATLGIIVSPGGGGLAAISGENFANDDFATLASGQYVLTMYMDSSELRGTLALTSSPGDILYEVTVAADAFQVGLVADGCYVLLAATASDTTSMDDFFASDEGGPPVPPPTASPAGLIFRITTLRYPEVEPEYVQRLTQFTDGEVEIELDEMRTARVTISMEDNAVDDVLPLERFLHVRYLGKVVFWGPILDPEKDFDTGTITINAIDPAYRLSKAFVRIGDDLETAGQATADSRGVRKFRDCGLNTVAQTDRGVPDLGISNGTNDVPNTDEIKVDVSRGDNALQGLFDLTGSADNPMDVEFEPQEIEAGSYVKLNTFIRQGEDKTDEVVFHFGWGVDNVETFAETPSGSLVVTHAHVLSQDLKFRGTAAASGPSARFGAYVYWDALDRNPVGDDEEEKEDQLRGIGKLRVEAYAEPPKLCQFTPRVTNGDDAVPKYLADFVIGDTVHVTAKKGRCVYDENVRVRKVTLKQENAQGIVRCEIDGAPTVGSDGDIGGDE